MQRVTVGLILYYISDIFLLSKIRHSRYVQYVASASSTE
jgi:hypothetical protein